MRKVKQPSWAAFLGTCGPNLFRKHKTRGIIVVPRARRDKMSPEQLEQRRRFKILMSCLSKLYLSYIKPYSAYWRKGYTPLQEQTRINVLNWSSQFRFHFIQLYDWTVPINYSPGFYSVPVEWKLTLNHDSLMYGALPAGFVVRVFFLYGRPFRLITVEREIRAGSGPIDFVFSPIGNWSYIYCYSFAFTINDYGVCIPFGQVRFTTYLGVYDGIPWTA